MQNGASISDGVSAHARLVATHCSTAGAKLDSLAWGLQHGSYSLR